MEAHSAGRRARARAIGWLLAGGAAMVLVWVALPHPAETRDGLVIGMVVATWLLAALLLAGRLRPRLAARHDGRAGGRRRCSISGDAARDRRSRERLRAVLRLPRAVRLRGDGAALRRRPDRRHRGPLRRRPAAARGRGAGRGGRRRPRRALARGRLRLRRARALRPPPLRAPPLQRGSLPARVRRLARRHGDHQRRLALVRGQRRPVPAARPHARAARRALARRGDAPGGHRPEPLGRRPAR